MHRATDLPQAFKSARTIARRHRVIDGSSFRLSDHDPADTGPFTAEDKPRAREALANGIRFLSELQEKLYASDTWSLLLILQALDAAGKDGLIKHVMSGVNPQGCQVVSFKAPSSEELDHDFLWRCIKRLPERGRIGIFNRSWYEEVLVVRVHRHLLEAQKLPPEKVTKRIWRDRCRDIRCFERYLSGNGTVVRKVFLNVSRQEQRRRFLERLTDPEKHWKFSAADIRERGHWDAYMDAYEDAIRRTATRDAPWYVVPADNKWYTRIVVGAVLLESLARLDLRYPIVTAQQEAALREARAQLESEG
ncbi:MAG: polyphosphate kinase 2 family protein [Phycisphaeraceae bacterium]|nr:polyphosphate kinase 2 family protein [Phycisphaeraceae bacterium]